MITFFATGKAFQGHNGIIQRNALKSWTLLHPGVEVILFGDDDGAAEVCGEFGLRHERFLMIGQRWDTDITAPIEFANQRWSDSLRALVQRTGFRQKRHYVDYFLFSRGLYDQVPPLVVGRSWWDHWLVWKALSRRVPVIDCSAAVVAVHQNHGYLYHPLGKEGTNDDDLARRNKALAANGKQLRFTVDATYSFTQKGHIRRTPFHKLAVYTLPKLVNSVIFNTLWIRKPLGLQRKNLEKLIKKLSFRM